MFVNLARDRVLTLRASIFFMVVFEMCVSLRAVKAHGNEGTITHVYLLFANTKT